MNQRIVANWSLQTAKQVSSLDAEKRDAGDMDHEGERQYADAAHQDHAAFAALYRQHVAPLYRYFYQQVGNAQDAEDLTATTFGKALASFRRYSGRGSFGAWLFSIGRHTLLDHRRGRKPPPQVEITVVAPLLADPAPQPEALLVRAEEAEQLRLLVRQLPDDQREALALRFFSELSTREVATVIGRSEGAVKMLIHRAVTALRVQYAQYLESNNHET